MIKAIRYTKNQFSTDVLGVSLLLSVVFLLFMSKQVSALELIHDSGNTVPADYGKIQTYADGADVALSRRRSYTAPPLVGRESVFPLETNLPVGEGEEITVEGLTSPVFIVGLDPDSLQWIELNLEVLQEINAIGYAVEGSEVDYLRVRAVLEEYGIAFNIAPGDAVAKAYGVTSYPVLLLK